MERIFSSWITYDPNIKTSQETCSQKWWYLELRVEPLIKVWLFWWHMCPKKICDVLVNKVLSSISLYNNWHNVYRTQLRCIVRCTWIENVSATIVKIVVCLPVISLRSSPSDAYYASASVFTRLLICKYSVPTKKKKGFFCQVHYPVSPHKLNTRDWVVFKHFQTLMKSQALVIAPECLSRRTDKACVPLTYRWLTWHFRICHTPN